jgi:murein DD-endopeptidase MepM/ murein hydrolase activator NlpD
MGACRGNVAANLLYLSEAPAAGEGRNLPVAQYKKVEKEFADRIGSSLRRLWASLLSFFKHVMLKGKQRFTVMLIPHSEKKIFNFQISFFTLVFLTFTLGVVLIGFILLATHFTSTNEKYTKVSQELASNESTLENLKDEISGIRKAGRSFKTRMDSVLKLLGNQDYLAAGSGGNPTIFMSPEDAEAGSLKELSELKGMTSLMENSIEPLEEIHSVLSTYKDLLADTPTLWPLKNVRGNVTTRYGWTLHPFTRQGYLHTGVDIAWGPGVPIVATANGEVAQTGWSDQLGNYVTLKHKYGFFTKYGHLSGIAARKGAKVNRGDTIGYLGSTGLSTGPHLHYEVRLGADYVDPQNFLSIKPDLAAVKINGRNGQ